MKFIEINGKCYERIPCGENDFLEYNKDRNPCKDCGVKAGDYHQIGCEAEICPAKEDCEIYTGSNKCAGQLCGCELSPKYVDEDPTGSDEISSTAENSTVISDLENVRIELENVIGMLQVCAIAFDYENALSCINERDLSGTFYSLQDQISRITEEVSEIISGEINSKK